MWALSLDQGHITTMRNKLNWQEKSLEQKQKEENKILTEILPAKKIYIAEGDPIRCYGRQSTWKR